MLYWHNWVDKTEYNLLIIFTFIDYYILINKLNWCFIFTDFEAIRKDIKSRLWFSYRKGFVAIGDSSYTTDKGWGCMLRCGQMLLAQALINLHLGI